MKTLVIAAAAALAAAATPAAAQDFTGPRVGVVGGYDDVQNRDGFTYGLVAGVDAPVAKGVIVGVEATLEDSTTSAGAVNASRELGVAVRAGVVVLPRVLAYGKVGYTNARFEVAGTNAGFSLEGLRYGGGVEYALTDRIYLGAEYRRTELEDNAGGRNGALATVGFRF